MAKIGFDVSRFFSPFQGDPLGGQKLYMQARAQGGQLEQEGLHALQRGLQARAELQQQRELAEQQLAMRQASLASLDAARQDASLRGNERLRMDREKMLQEQQKLQGTTDADALRALLDPLRRGDVNAMETARAAAQARDPSLSVALPGEARPTLVPGMASADEVYGPADSLRVERGGQSLAEMDRQQALKNEADVFLLMTDPLRKSRYADAYEPALQAGEAATGRGGGTGREMAESAIEQANREANRRIQEQQAQGAREDRALARAASGENRDFQHRMAIHGAVEKVVTRYQPEIKKLDEDDMSLQNILDGMATDSGWMQRSALAENLRRMSGKASSNMEMMEQQSRAGQWERLHNIANGWISSGELSPEFVKEVQEGTAALAAANKAQRMRLGLRARDSIYASSELPFADPARVVAAANQVWTGLGLDPLTPEEMAAETQRIARLRGGMGAPMPAAPGGVDVGPLPDASGNVVPMDAGVRDDPRLRGSGAAGNLGVTGQRPGQLPLVPVQPPQRAPEDDETEDIIRQYDEVLNAQP